MKICYRAQRDGHHFLFEIELKMLHSLLQQCLWMGISGSANLRISKPNCILSLVCSTEQHRVASGVCNGPQYLKDRH